jgi:hypothetical protein
MLNFQSLQSNNHINNQTPIPPIKPKSLEKQRDVAKPFFAVSMWINSFKQNYWILTIELSLKYLRRRKMVSIPFVSNGICSSVWFSMDCKKMSVELVCNTLHPTCSRKYDLNKDIIIIILSKYFVLT